MTLWDHLSEEERVVVGEPEDYDHENAIELPARKGRAGIKRPGFQIGRKSPRREERRFDTTALHYDQSGRTISHADYMAHCEKYDYAWRQISQGDKILDVGCGTDQALVRAITKDMNKASVYLLKGGGGYVGVDLNKIRNPSQISWATVIGELDATDPDLWPQIRSRPEAANEILFGEYTLGICLEVIEHMDVPDGQRLLETFREGLAPGGRLVLSTPVYDGKGMARNHVHEYYVDELWALIEEVGLTVERRMGTFTSEPVLLRWLKANRPDWLALYMEAREFHSAGYMSGVLAPMLPDISRNNVWLIRKRADW